MGFLWCFSNELEELENIVSAIKAVLVGAEEQQFHSHQVKNWLQRLQVAVYDAGNEFSRQVCTYFSTSNQLAFRFKMVHKMKDFRKKLAGISAIKKDFLPIISICGMGGLGKNCTRSTCFQ